MAMVRKQVYIRTEQEAALKNRARALGVTEAALIRRGLDLAGQPPATDEPPFDVQAWQEERAFMAERVRQHGGPSARARAWTRADLYEGRLARVAR